MRRGPQEFETDGEPGIDHRMLRSEAVQLLMNAALDGRRVDWAIADSLREGLRETMAEIIDLYYRATLSPGEAVARARGLVDAALSFRLTMVATSRYAPPASGDGLKCE